ncbi:MAG: NUMOD3 domain-containing DNA-binding protein [bacterium]
MSFNSYTGYYNNNYLRSSYEYIYAKILEKKNIKYKTEAKTYILKDGRSFKPDFFLYKGNQLVKIVEIKSERDKLVKEGIEKIRLLNEKLDIPVIMLQSKELNELCSKNQMNYYKLKNEWINYEKTSQVHNVKGKKNPMYGKKHTKKSKIINGKKTKKRFQNPDFVKKHSKAVKKAMKNVEFPDKFGGYYSRKKRKIRKCIVCGNEFKVIEGHSERACSNSCGSLLGIFEAKRINRAKNKERNREIRHIVIEYAKKNREFIWNIPFNNISNNLDLIFKNILSKYNLKDVRNIFYAFYGQHSNKYRKLLKDLKLLIK